MARNITAKNKMERRFGLMPNNSGKRLKKKSEYGLALEEKQKLKFIYGIMEKQLRRYVSESLKSSGNPVETLSKLIETRLDNVVYRANFTLTREQARQFTSHGHVLVNDKRVNIPSYHVKPGNEIKLTEKFSNRESFQNEIKKSRNLQVPSWMSRSENIARIDAYPVKEDFTPEVNVVLIIELYSR